MCVCARVWLGVGVGVGVGEAAQSDCGHTLWQLVFVYMPVKFVGIGVIKTFI